MRSIRIGIKHIMRVVTVFTALVAMTIVYAGNAYAVEIGPLGNTVIERQAIGSQVIATQPFGNQFFSAPIANPFFRPTPFFRPVGFNPFFRPTAFNPFFRPAFFNPFFGADLDDFGFGVGIREDD